MAGVERVSAFTTPGSVSVYQGDRVTQLDLRRVDADYWKILDFHVVAGRLPDEDDERLGRLVAVVNASTARRLFAGGPAVGQRISAGGQTFHIVGVVADVVHLNAYADMWAPLTTFPSTDYQKDLPRIQREVARIATTVVTEDPHAFPITQFWADSKLDVFARVLLSRQSEPDSGAARLLLLIGAGMLLFMLLPALNLVNLNMGRILERGSEIGLRKAFGATSLQLAGQLVVENVLLCLAGGLLGLACARLVLWWLEASQLIPYLEVDINLPVFGYGMLLALVFGLLSGALPAWKMSRLDPVHALKGAA
jgi:putative ABC transport system permease protein